MKKILLTVILLTFTSVVYAQPPATGKNKIGFDQEGPTLTEVQAYTWKYYADTATTGIILTGVSCIGTVSPYQCEAPFPAFTPGSHILTLTTSNLAGESIKSAPLSFAFVVTPGAPINIKIK
jgi:hypothetical protein